MIHKYRGIAQPAGMLEVVVSKKSERTAAQTPWGTTVTHAIKGRLNSQAANPQADIIAKAAALELQFGQDGGDSILYLVNGTTPSHHSLKSSDCIGGTRIIEPISFPNGRGAQNVTYLDWTVTIQGTIPLPQSQLATNLQSFVETLEFGATGRKRLGIETLIGRPVMQTGRQYQLYRATQQGTAIGLDRIPTIPPAIWPWALVDQYPRKIYGHPEIINGVPRNFEVTWTYDYIDAFPLIGQQHIWFSTWNQ